MYPNSQIEQLNSNPDSFLCWYIIVFIVSALLSTLFLTINDPESAFAFGIASMGIVCFLPLIAFNKGQWNGALSPYSIVFATNCISFLTLGIGAWNIPNSVYSSDIPIEALAKAELIVSSAQFFLNFAYLIAISRSYRKSLRSYTHIIENQPSKNIQIVRDYKSFSLIIVGASITYILMRLTVFSANGSTQGGIDSALSGNPIYALGFAFVSLYPFIICPTVALCAVNQPKFKPWLYLILLGVFASLLQSTLRREILSFFFSLFGSFLFIDKKLYKKAALGSFIMLPFAIMLSFLGFIFRQIKQVSSGSEFSSSSQFLTTVLPEVYKTITDLDRLQILWQGFIDNVFIRFLGLDPIARVINKDVFLGGQATFYSFMGVVPRFLWPDKPATGGKDEEIIINSLQATLSTDRTVTYQLQFLADFGVVGLVIISILLGVLYASIHFNFLKVMNDKFDSIYYFLIFSFVLLSTFEGTLTTVLVFLRQALLGTIIIYLLDKIFLYKRIKVKKFTRN